MCDCVYIPYIVYSTASSECLQACVHMIEGVVMYETEVQNDLDVMVDVCQLAVVALYHVFSHVTHTVEEEKDCFHKPGFQRLSQIHFHDILTSINPCVCCFSQRRMFGQ